MPEPVFEPSELFPEVPNLFEFLSVHSDMLSDVERVGRYVRAIRAVVHPGAVVADIGTGTGLLAFECLKAGAKYVHAVERSGAIRWAERLAQHNGFADRIHFHHCDSRDLQLMERVDVVVSELIGHMAFEEGMIEALVDARERLLAPGGLMIPQVVDLRAAVISESQLYPNYIDCWTNIDDIDLSPLREDALRTCYLTALSPNDLLSEPETFFSFDFTCDALPALLSGQRRYRTFRAGTINGIALWFRAALAPGIDLSSSPWSQTHWKQCFAPLARPIDVTAGETIEVFIDMRLRNRDRADFEFSSSVRRIGDAERKG